MKNVLQFIPISAHNQTSLIALHNLTTILAKCHGVHAYLVLAVLYKILMAIYYRNVQKLFTTDTLLAYCDRAPGLISVVIWWKILSIKLSSDPLWNQLRWGLVRYCNKSRKIASFFMVNWWRHLNNNIMYFQEFSQLRYCFLFRANRATRTRVLAR